MSDTRFDLAITHHTSELPIEKLVQALMELLGRNNDSYLEYKLSEALLFEGSGATVVDNLTKEEGEKLQERFRSLNVETTLRPTLELVSKDVGEEQNDVPPYVCPACEHQQPKAQNEASNVCQNCGVVGEKYAKRQEKTKVLEEEKRKLQHTQTKAMREALDRARYAEQERMRQEAKQELGVGDKKKSPLVVAGGVAAILALGVGGVFMGIQYLNSQGNSEQTVADANQGSLEQGASANQESQEGKGLKVSIDAGSGIQVDGISDPSARPTVDAPTLDGEQLAQAQAQGAQGRESKAQNAQQQPVPAKPKRLSPSELEGLKLIMRTPSSSQKFERITVGEYKESQARLERLLTMGMPELALVHASESPDPYATSLLILRITQVHVEQNLGASPKEIVRALEALSLQFNDGPQGVLILNNVAVAQGLLGRTADSLQILTDMANRMNRSLPDQASFTLAQKYDLLLQMMQDHKKYGHAAGMPLLLEQGEQILADIPEDAFVQRSQAYTSLASGALIMQGEAQANNWLQRLEDPQAKTQLSKYVSQAPTN